MPYNLQMENHSSASLGDPPFKGLVMTSDQPLLLNGVYPGFFPGEVNSVTPLDSQHN